MGRQVYANNNEYTYHLALDALYLWKQLKRLGHHGQQRALQRYIRRYHMWRDTWQGPKHPAIRDILTGELIDA